MSTDHHPIRMSLNLDHCFIITELQAPQAAQLSKLGLVEGTRNQHPGQGTANRRFFFSNAMLELLYVWDESEARHGPGRRLRFVERAADTGASPFGLIMKSPAGLSATPFQGWRYHPDYFEADKYFHVGENADVLAEPLCIYVPFELPLPANQPRSAEPFTNVSELRISVPVDQPSSVLQAVAQIEGVSICLEEPHLMEIVFNDEKLGQSKDMRPGLPLIIRW